MILISAGHSNVDPGACANGVKEADIAREFRNIVATKLKAMGVACRTDGEAMENKPLTDAIKLIAGTNLAIEFHCNAAASSQAGGVEAISLPSKQKVSQEISAAIAGVMGTKLRGENGWIDQSKSARGKLGFVQAGGIIVELFFISNPQELATYQAKKWLVAQAVADVIKGHA